MSAFSSGNVHINPNFKGKQNGQRVHINPNFKTFIGAGVAPCNAVASTTCTTTGSKILLNPNVVYVNPNFTKRAVSSSTNGGKTSQLTSRVPEVPSLERIRNEELQPISNKKSGSIFVNPKFQPKKAMAVESFVSGEKKSVTNGPEISTASVPNGKENVSSSASSTSARRKSVFKKIGTRKLIRVRRKSLASPSPLKLPKTPIKYKKIGSRKLIRVISTSELNQRLSPRNGSRNTVYIVKTKKKIVKTSANSKRSFVLKVLSPISLAKNRHKSLMKFRKRLQKKSLTHYPTGIVSNPFKVDRRLDKKGCHDGFMSKKLLNTKFISPTSTKYFNGSPLTRRRASRKNLLKSGNNALVNISGVKFKVSDRGKKLTKIEKSAAVSSPANASSPKDHLPIYLCTTPLKCSLSRKLFVQGEEFVENEPGVLVRSNNLMTRECISKARNRSIRTLMKYKTRNKQCCMFFNKFGKCNKKEKGICPYIHDPEKVAICKRFLQGRCHKEICLLSHKIDPEKMPTCTFFLEDQCSKKESCPYRHVKVSPDADICLAYLRGDCKDGLNCNKRHLTKCPAFDKDGKCPRGSRCIYPHSSKGDKSKSKGRSKIADTSESGKDKSAGKKRYFDGHEEKSFEDKNESQDIDANPKETDITDPILLAKRQRLLHRVELAKQGWTATALMDIHLPEDNEHTVNTENAEENDLKNTIGDDETETNSRAPLGELPSFIPLEPMKVDHAVIIQGEEQEARDISEAESL